MIDPLLTLLDSPDPDVQTQGVELARALGSEATDRVLASCKTGPDGRLWRPLGLSNALLSLLLDAPPSDLTGIRQLTLCGQIDPKLLARLVERIPRLTSLTLSAMELEDLSLVARFFWLSSLSILHSSVDDLSPLKKLRMLRHLSLSHCQVRKIDALSRLTGITSLSLEGVDAPTVNLPTRLTTLNINQYKGTVGNLKALRLRTLTLNTVQMVSCWPILTRLSDLRIIGTTRVRSLAGLPVTALDLRAIGGAVILTPLLALPRLHTLRLLNRYTRREPLSLAPLHAHPTLSVVNYPRKNDFEFMDYGPTWVPDVAQTQWLLSSLSPNDHPLKKQDILARASAHWREAGRRYQLDLMPIEKQAKTRASQVLRSHVAVSITESRELFDVLLTDGLRCLTLDEAVTLQGWLRRSGMPARISRWTA